MKAYLAIQTPAVGERQAVAFLRERLPDAPELNDQQIALLIADLDSTRFAVRQKATEELGKAGGVAERALRMKLKERPSLEVRQRIEQLLDRLSKPLSGDQLQALRAVEVLEHIGSPEAKQVLEKLATGAEGARLTREAKASLGRLRERAAAVQAAGRESRQGVTTYDAFGEIIRRSPSPSLGRASACYACERTNPRHG